MNATATLIARETEPRTRRRRSEARAKVATSAVAYLRVSTEEQATSGLGLASQRADIEAFAARHGITILAWHEDAGISAASIGKRPAFLDALRSLSAGEAGMLIAKDASRVSRSLKDLANILAAADMDGWCLATADGLINTCDPQGSMLAHFLGVVADLQRVFIGQQTKAALASAKARGVVVGRRSRLPASTRTRLHGLHDDGLTAAGIADALNVEQLTTSTGLPWTARLVTKALTVTQ